MPTPELIRRMSARNAEIKAARQVLSSIDRYAIVEEQAEQQSEADNICREMRVDCENLLNAHGIVKTRPLSMYHVSSISLFVNAKGRVLESSTIDDEGEEIAVTIFSTKINPAKYSEIIVRIGEDFEYNESFLSLKRDHGNIKIVQPRSGGYVNHIRRANLQDAREWKEVVDALKNQNQTSQSSPIEYK